MILLLGFWHIRYSYANKLNNKACTMADSEKAMRTIEKAIKLNPMNPVYYANMGLLYAATDTAINLRNYMALSKVSSEALDKSLAYFHLANNMAPKNRLFSLNLGLLYALNGKYLKAKSFFEKAVENSDEEENVLLWALFCESHKQFVEAKRAFVKALIIAPYLLETDIYAKLEKHNYCYWIEIVENVVKILSVRKGDPINMAKLGSVLLYKGEKIEDVVDMASRWNVEGLIILGYDEERYRQLSRKLNKKMILIDAYPEGEYTFQNVGVDDYSGGYQVGEYLYSCGYHRALFIAETDKDSDSRRWNGFKQAMEKQGGFCSKSRLIVVPGEKRQRLSRYEELLPRFLEVKALAFSSDYGAIEAMNYFFDHGIKVPDQISIVGYDDNIYAEFVRPRLTTVHQDIHQKGVISLRRLHRMIEGETLKEMNIKSPVRLIKRESVKE